MPFGMRIAWWVGSPSVTHFEPEDHDTASCSRPQVLSEPLEVVSRDALVEAPWSKSLLSAAERDGL